MCSSHSKLKTPIFSGSVFIMNLILILSLVSMIWLLNSLEGCYFIELLVCRHFRKMCRLYPVKHVFVWMAIVWSRCCIHIAFVVLILKIKVVWRCWCVLVHEVKLSKTYRSLSTTSSSHITHIINSMVY